VLGPDAGHSAQPPPRLQRWLFCGMVMLGEQPTWHDFAALACVLVAIATVLLPVGAAPRTPE